MKRAVLIFCVLYILTLSVPVSAVAVNKKQNDTKELVTMFKDDGQNGEENEIKSQDNADKEAETETGEQNENEES